MNYPFEIINVNGRDISIADVLNGSITPQTPFESSSFSFIRQWCGQEESFAQQTSGSTGAPKTIFISRKAMVASAKLTQQALELKTGETALLCLDANYIAGKMMIVRAFVTGMKLLVVDPSLNPFEKIGSETTVDFAAVVPAQLSAIVESPQQNKLNEIRNIIVGGAPLPNDTIRKLAAFQANIYLTYGMTETVSHVALQRVNGPYTSEYFTTLPGVETNVDDRGCLQIKVPFLDYQITTNDIVEIKSATQFKWLGRSDNVINSGGLKIIPEEIEAKVQKVFAALQISNRFIVSSLPDPLLGNKLVLLVEGNFPVSIDSVKLALQQAMPRYHVPKQIIEDATFAITENGKINREETRKKTGI